jgi:methyl coenzyme M reductase subunit C-like uncharacterized protein (methanogenesis marker protein 7)
MNDKKKEKDKKKLINPNVLIAYDHFFFKSCILSKKMHLYHAFKIHGYHCRTLATEHGVVATLD